MKKIIITCLITFFITIGLVHLYDNWYIDYNLRKYSVYYAHNMEHKEGTHPEMAMAIENMGFIHKPNKKNIRYREDGGFAIYNNFTDGKQVIIIHDIKEKKVDIYFMTLWIKTIFLMKLSD